MSDILPDFNVNGIKLDFYTIEEILVDNINNKKKGMQRE